MTTEIDDSCRVALMTPLMATFSLLVALLISLGCGCERAETGRVEMQRRATLKRIYRGGTLQERRAQDYIISQLQQANASTLRHPRIVFAQITDDVKGVGVDGVVRVEWIAAKPSGDGVRFAFSDGDLVDVPISSLCQGYNAAVLKTEGLLLFGASVFLRQERPRLWKDLLIDERVQVCLLLQGQPISGWFPLTKRSLAEPDNSSSTCQKKYGMIAGFANVRPCGRYSGGANDV